MSRVEESESGMQMCSRGKGGPARRALGGRRGGRGEGPWCRRGRRPAWMELPGQRVPGSWPRGSAPTDGGTSMATSLRERRGVRAAFLKGNQGEAWGLVGWERALKAPLERPAQKLPGLVKHLLFAALCRQCGQGNNKVTLTRRGFVPWEEDTHMCATIPLMHTHVHTPTHIHTSHAHAHVYTHHTHTCAQGTCTHIHLDKVNIANLDELQNHDGRSDNGSHNRGLHFSRL